MFPGLLRAQAPRRRKRPRLHQAIMYGTIGAPGSVLEKLTLVRAAGFEGVEPMSHMNHDEVLSARAATGLKMPSVCCATHWDKPLSDPDPAVREAGLAGLHQALRDAHLYGATSVLLVPGVVNDKVTYQQCWDRSITEIRKAIPWAKALGVRIAIEEVWNNFITKPDQAVAFLDAIDSPWVGWHFDIGNVIKYSPPEDWIPVLGKRILKFHFKEYSKTKGFEVQFFEGDDNWPAIMHAIDAIGYRGWAISEQPAAQTKDAASLTAFAARMARVLDT